MAVTKVDRPIATSLFAVSAFGTLISLTTLVILLRQKSSTVKIGRFSISNRKLVQLDSSVLLLSASTAALSGLYLALPQSKSQSPLDAIETLYCDKVVVPFMMNSLVARFAGWVNALTGINGSDWPFWQQMEFGKVQSLKMPNVVSDDGLRQRCQQIVEESCGRDSQLTVSSVQQCDIKPGLLASTSYYSYVRSGNHQVWFGSELGEEGAPYYPETLRCAIKILDLLVRRNPQAESQHVFRINRPKPEENNYILGSYGLSTKFRVLLSDGEETAKRRLSQEDLIVFIAGFLTDGVPSKSKDIHFSDFSHQSRTLFLSNIAATDPGHVAWSYKLWTFFGEWPEISGTGSCRVILGNS